MKWEKYPFKIEKQYRLPNWDYSNCGYYFITICTKDRENFFGEIKKCKIHLSKIGLIVDFSISQIPVHFPKYVVNCYSVMPNHIHLLVENRLAGDSFCRNRPWPVPTDIKPTPWPVPTDIKPTPWPVPTDIKPTPRPIIPADNNFYQHVPSDSVSSVINHFKGYVTKESLKINPKFKWQSRFHDHIIRNKKEYWAVKKYIQNNPKNWDLDVENKI